MKIIGIIPARMGSTRFPGKPLAEIKGKAMIFHVYFRSKLSPKFDGVYIATPDVEIKEYCDKHGMEVIMTKDSHERASDRAAEAMIKIEELTNEKTDIVVMIQGDEPIITPEMIDKSLEPIIQDPNMKIVNLMGPLDSIDQEEDPNLVKVVVDKNDYAMYYSREPIPSRKKWKKEAVLFKQVPIIPFTRDFLIKFNQLEPTCLEEIESIDMLRVLEHGYKVKMVPIEGKNQSVDTEEDLKKVQKMMETDDLFNVYCS